MIILLIFIAFIPQNKTPNKAVLFYVLRVFVRSQTNKTITEILILSFMNECELLLGRIMDVLVAMLLKC